MSTVADELLRRLEQHGRATILRESITCEAVERVCEQAHALAWLYHASGVYELKKCEFPRFIWPGGSRIEIVLPQELQK